MIRLPRTISILLATLSTLFLSGCALLAIPAIYLIDAGDGEKDVSSDFQRGHIVGKDYELLEDLYLLQYIYSEEMQLSTSQCYDVKFKDGKSIVSPSKHFPLIKIAPKGSRFRVCAVIIHTNYGSEGGPKKILANFIDENGKIIEQENIHGKIRPFDAMFLFKSLGLPPHENWSIKPSTKWVKELYPSE
jgi:hypothetical protein